MDGHEDPDQNIIALKIKINGNIYVIVSIYGPNGSCPVFFRNLDTYLNALVNKSVAGIIVGGDWNTVLNSSPVNENIDLCNMLTFPNHPQNSKLTSFAEKWKLFDPFRIKNPMSREFSYAPFGTLRKNRSRLDFFFISESLIPALNTAEIQPGRLCRLFDHAVITTNLGGMMNEPGKKKSTDENLCTKL
jgi:exonuclease III